MLAKKFALGFGIAVIFPLMIHYGVATFVHEPKWQDYHRWEDDYRVDRQNMTQQEKQEMADRRKQRQQAWQYDQKQFQRALFSVAAPLGIVAIVLGSLISIQAIGTGLMFGGIFSVLDGYFNYWSELPDGARFISLLLAFIVLVYVGWRKMAK
ncbi:MAG: hypothetical protein PHH75_05950 [Candidatus Omnitrophica bacterium]|nr:hypothetical protein [Candidatus Omnitrophota bacterium]MDD5574705.1 hypothetical protein [Candidatus Omnitrophota bacterium]